MVWCWLGLGDYGGGGVTVKVALSYRQLNPAVAEVQEMKTVAVVAVLVTVVSG